jgi:transcriptional regulator with XRE-family HTH domain
MSLSTIIRTHRRVAGLSRNELAALAGVGKTVLYDLEHGKTSVRFDIICKVLHVLNIKIVFESPLPPHISPDAI